MASHSVTDTFDLILSTASPSIITVRRQTHQPHPPTRRLTGACIGRWVAGGLVELSVSPLSVSPILNVILIFLPSDLTMFQPGVTFIVLSNSNVHHYQQHEPLAWPGMGHWGTSSPLCLQQ